MFMSTSPTIAIRSPTCTFSSNLAFFFKILLNSYKSYTVCKIVNYTMEQLVSMFRFCLIPHFDTSVWPPPAGDCIFFLPNWVLFLTTVVLTISLKTLYLFHLGSTLQAITIIFLYHCIFYRMKKTLLCRPFWTRD